MPSQRQLAQIAGVSISTVSRALRNDPRLLPETCQRIQELAALYHYRPNRLIQALMSGKSSAIGLLIPHVSSVYFSHVLRGVMEQAFSESYHVIVLQSFGKLASSCIALQTFVELQVDGILIATGHSSPIPKNSILELWSHEIPAVRIGDDTPVDAPLDTVSIDEEQLADLAIGYLWDLGHREIGYIGYPYVGLTSGVQQALKRKGLSLAYCQDLSDDNSVQHILAQWRTLPTPPTAVFAYSDSIAAELLQVAARAHIRIPRDLTVLGCANLLPLVAHLIPPLTTIETHPVMIGQRAFDLLWNRMQSDDLFDKHSPEFLSIPATLVERASCAAPRHQRQF